MKSANKIESPARWANNGLPRKGWELIDVVECESLSECDWCGTSIRYIHIIHHTEVEDESYCGCICAGHLTDDYVTSKKREKLLRKKSSAMLTWMDSPRWKIARTGNVYRKDKEWLITIFPNKFGYGFKINFDSQTQGKIFSTIEDAKRVSLDIYLKLKEQQNDPSTNN